MAKAIQTYYNGHNYRSRLEAKWAMFFEKAGIEFQYEPEGIQFDDGVRYLPDFYLPQQNTFFECKGLMSDYDESKIKHLCSWLYDKTGDMKEVIIGYPEMKFEIVWAEDDSEGRRIFVHCNDDMAWLCKCKSCGKVFFMNGWYGWHCRICNYYDGDNGFVILAEGNEDNHTYKPLHEANIARFEYGDNPSKY